MKIKAQSVFCLCGIVYYNHLLELSTYTFNCKMKQYFQPLFVNILYYVLLFDKMYVSMQ